MSSEKYLSRGVSADKSEVHEAIKGLDKGLFPYSFCKILPDFLTGDEAYCTLMHADTAGTKTSLAYMYWKETGDISIWKGIVQDALVMNTDDMACSGCLNDIIVSSTIGRNKHLISGEVIKVLIQAAQEFFEEMSRHGVSIHSAGGETADVGDIVRTADVGFTAFARMKRADVIDVKIHEGNYIVGLASYGQATYESSYNGGMGSNGLTSARHDVFASVYRDKYPETFDHNTDINFIYSGSKLLTDVIDINGTMIPLGKLVLSPTRTFLPILKKIIPQHKEAITGIIHNTGGGDTKVTKNLNKPLPIVKDKLLTVPPLF
ncbi:MAG TPA: phosphoribosylformylglycinamidine cyclo-ligase [Saprospiraceae bacterium]|nr:phosphoribosylformylglycinamidine cyclo-ligase [Saprospiraceae bacterium]